MKLVHLNVVFCLGICLSKLKLFPNIGEEAEEEDIASFFFF